MIAFKKSKLICFPTKPLLSTSPWLSWQQSSSLSLIIDRLPQLVQLGHDLDHYAKIAVPLLGCGNGGLESSSVLQVLKQFLNDKFIIFTYGI